MNDEDDVPILPSEIDEDRFWRELDDALTPHDLTNTIRQKVTAFLEDFLYDDVREFTILPPPLSVDPEWIEADRPTIGMRARDLEVINECVDAVRDHATQLLAVLDRLNRVYVDRWRGDTETPPFVDSTQLRRVLRKLITRCEEDWPSEDRRFYEGWLAKGGRPENMRRSRLVRRVIRLFDSQGIPLTCADSGVLANVLRVVLAAADAVEGEPTRDRRHIKKEIRVWLREHRERMNHPFIRFLDD